VIISKQKSENMKKNKIVIVSAVFVCVVLLGLVFGANPKKEVSDINIGSIGPLTGAAASYGEKMTRAIDLAVNEVNENG